MGKDNNHRNFVMKHVRLGSPGASHGMGKKANFVIIPFFAAETGKQGGNGDSLILKWG